MNARQLVDTILEADPLDPLDPSELIRSVSYQHQVPAEMFAFVASYTKLPMNVNFIPLMRHNKRLAKRISAYAPDYDGMADNAGSFNLLGPYGQDHIRVIIRNTAVAVVTAQILGADTEYTDALKSMWRNGDFFEIDVKREPLNNWFRQSGYYVSESEDEPNPEELVRSLPTPTSGRMNNTVSVVFVHTDSGRYLTRNLTTTDDILDAVKFHTRDGALEWIGRVAPDYSGWLRIANLAWTDPDKI